MNKVEEFTHNGSCIVQDDNLVFMIRAILVITGDQSTEF